MRDLWLTEISKKYKKRSNTQIVLDMLEDAMLSKQLKLGDMLPSETVLSTSLGVSKSSVREAIKMLEGIGVVAVSQGKGTVIRSDFIKAGSNLLVFQLILAEKSPDMLIEFRYLFEPMYIKLAMEKAKDKDLTAIEDYLMEVEQKIIQNKHSYLDDLEFHQMLLEITQNTIIISIGNILNKMLKTAFEKAMYVYPLTVLENHRKIFQAIKNKDYAAVQQITEKSLADWTKIFFD